MVGKKQRILGFALRQEIHVIAVEIWSRDDHWHKKHDRRRPVDDGSSYRQIFFVGKNADLVKEEDWNAKNDQIKRNIQTEQRYTKMAVYHQGEGF